MESPMEHPRYARFWSRAAARVIDLLIIIAAFNLFYLVNQLGADAGLWTGMEQSEGGRTGAGFYMANALRIIFFLTFPGFYFVYLHGAYGQTIGKMILHISVVNTNGSHIDYRKALMRHLVEIFLSLILGFLIIITVSIVGSIIAFLFSAIGLFGSFLKTVYNYIAIIIPLIFSPCPVFLWAAFDPRKQGLHDKVCKTFVVWTGVPSPLPAAVEPESPAAPPPDDPASLDTGTSPSL